jgi:ABC-type glutathione transport system ATPase component
MSPLTLESVSVRYSRAGAHFDAVRDVSFSVAEGEVLALVGESGSGKSTLARAIVGLTPISMGSITFDDKPLPTRGRRPVGIVFQNPLGSLDARMSVEKALAEILQVHRLVPATQRRQRCHELLELVGLPQEVARLKPGSLSGGQQQRVSIARAMAAEPRILILDEPVSALDVSIRAQVLRLLDDLRSRLGIGLLFIGHDLAVVRQLADRVAVLYRGELVEMAPAEQFFASPEHEYSRLLLDSVPSLASPAKREETTAVSENGDNGDES